MKHDILFEARFPNQDQVMVSFRGKIDDYSLNRVRELESRGFVVKMWCFDK